MEKNNSTKSNITKEEDNNKHIIKLEESKNEKDNTMLSATKYEDRAGGAGPTTQTDINNIMPNLLNNQDNQNFLNMDKEKLFQTFILFQNFMSNMNTGQNSMQTQLNYFNQMTMQMNKFCSFKSSK
jgi:hypothetical protein